MKRTVRVHSYIIIKINRIDVANFKQGIISNTYK